jgi:methyl-accepting chemotaxis protein
MKQIFSRRKSYPLSFSLVIALTAFSGGAQEKDRSKEGQPPPAPAAARVDEPSTQAKEVLAWGNDMAKEISQAIEGWLGSGAVTQERLFAYLYYPIADTDPTKYTTDYDTLADRDFQPIIDKYVAKSNLLIFALATDRNGYAPTHNRQFSQPLTGNRAVDLVNNRTKRMFGDQIGFRAARNQKPYLIQAYARDTGEIVADLSIPILIRGRHWGCVRIGYRQVDRQQ